MKHCILVPWDGSDCARRALVHAMDLARARGDCSVLAAYAHEEPALYGEIEAYVPRAKMEELQHERSLEVLAQAEELLRNSGLPHRTEVLVGPPGKVLAERAASLGCDAIVMGTHGRGAVGSLVMGSVATKTIHFSSVPVTLVK